MGYSPWGCKRVRHDLATKQQQINEIIEMKSLRELSIAVPVEGGGLHGEVVVRHTPCFLWVHVVLQRVCIVLKSKAMEEPVGIRPSHLH